ncbi:MAG: hypothetical protein KKB62_02635 [Nanoarchaeota archaeon]|nr:hypothetical protein [Nanoarchaeota archaeon]
MSETKKDKEFRKIENEEVRNKKELIWDCIKTGKELEILSIFHEGKFNSPLSQEYLNYSLDFYNYFKEKGESEAYSKYMSVAKTIEKMANDKIFEDYSKKINERKITFWDDEDYDSDDYE